MFNKLIFLFLFLIIKLTFPMLRGPMPLTKEKEGGPQFWSFNQPSLPKTTEKPISVEDYYDAVKEDEELNKKEKLKEDETSSALHLMTALQTNINPLFPILANRNSEKKEKKKIESSAEENDSNKRFLVDYDGERIGLSNIEE